ncbi:MAG: MoxR family ATPase [Candidatus Marinimicrobia bacterium]|nr:MoxR family ATPase [Candidatus Neomarinimicrobiota bacterium]
MDNLQLVEILHQRKDDIYNEIGKVIIGQKSIIEHLFVALLCQGHILLEGVPGLAKTLLIKTLSDVLELKFNRIQFTPDLMPSDITGTEIIEQDSEQGKRMFKFFRGPVFANILLADEINRTPPKTQSALLEAMQEHKVTAGGTTYTLEEPFFVLATQNPIEQEGTYPLPEAQLDRFMFNLKIDYPSFNEEVEIVKSTTGLKSVQLQHVVSRSELSEFQKLVKNVPAADNVIEYAVSIVSNTRPKNDSAPKFVKDWLEWGAGPRASSYLILGAKALAVMDGRTTPDVDDVKRLVKPVLRHRVITNFNAEADNIQTDDILSKLMDHMSSK